MSSVSAQLVIESSGELLLKRGNSEYRQSGVGERLVPGDRLYPLAGVVAKILCDNSYIWRVPDGIPSALNSGCPTLMTNLVRGETSNRPGGSDPNIPYILYPRMTYVFRERPTFRWNGVPGATRYTVRLLGPGGVEWQSEVSSTEVSYPDDAPPLNWATKYLVAVEATNGSSSLDDSGGTFGFEMLDEFDIQYVQAEAERILGLEELTEGERAIALAEMYRRESLFAEAIATLEAQIEQGNQSALVYSLLADLYSEVGLNSLAEARHSSAVALPDYHSWVDPNGAFLKILPEVSDPSEVDSSSFIQILTPRD
ncbi:MAG: tetratricopeptide repeat protein [Synechococcus sp.]